MKTRLVNKFIVEDYGKQLLEERGIFNTEEFLNPTSDNLQSWEDLTNIEEGKEIIFNLKHNSYIGLVVD